MMVRNEHDGLCVALMLGHPSGMIENSLSTYARCSNIGSVYVAFFQGRSHS
jgi:hypothetical protein